jgi:hypothetical protein
MEATFFGSLNVFNFDASCIRYGIQRAMDAQETIRVVRAYGFPVGGATELLCSSSRKIVCHVPMCVLCMRFLSKADDPAP